MKILLQNKMMPLFIIFIYEVLFVSSINITVREDHYEYIIWQNNSRNDLFTYDPNNSKFCSCEPTYLYYMNHQENNTLVQLILEENEEYQGIHNASSSNAFLVNYNLKTDSNNSSITEKKYNLSINHQCPNQITSDKDNTYALISFTIDILNTTDSKIGHYSFDFMKNCEDNKLIRSIITITILFLFAIISVYFGTKTKLFIETGDKKPDGEISTTNVFTLAIAGSIMLLLIFYFANNYFFQISFTCFIGSQMILSLYLTLKSTYEAVYLPKYIPLLNTIIIYGMEIYSFFILTLTILIVILYFLTKYWFLNNLLAFSLSYVFLLLRHLTNFKECTIFLVVICFYDIFWVYFSPWVFKANVMERAATSISLPIKLEMPIIYNSNPLKVCMMLGLGDIIIPGFIIKFCKRFDFIKSVNIYYKTGLICYTIALILSGIAAIGFKHPQPVIFFMCFCIIIGVSCIAYSRNELSEIWNADDLERKLLESMKQPSTVIQLNEVSNDHTDEEEEEEEDDDNPITEINTVRYTNKKRKRRRERHHSKRRNMNDK